MLDRLKRVLVESFVGAIALGYLFASAILNFVNIFVAPVAGWASQKTYPGIIRQNNTLGLPLQVAIPQLVSFLVLVLVWYILLRWLYFAAPAIDESVAELNSK